MGMMDAARAAVGFGGLFVAALVALCVGLYLLARRR